ncbi:MAG: hypothetical protein FWD37_04475 [Methanomassiliicoccaceae archaeon]|nr:hypothetical protein [Methanomassiliicoccaceae archaeon]
MDIEKAFENVQMHIGKEEYDKAGTILDSVVSFTKDIRILLKCASILKVTEDDVRCQDVLDKISETNIPSDERLAVAISLRGLGRPEDAYDIIKNEKDSDKVHYERARTLLLMNDDENAFHEIEMIAEKGIEHRILLSEILCSLKRYDDAYRISSQVVNDDNNSYRSLVNLCASLTMMRKEKEAVKIAKQHLKNGSTDSLALFAYVMRINGRLPAAAAYAHKAIMKDNTHKGALETMAYCLIEKGRFREAKIAAGAINEVSPGDTVAIRILDACRRS